MRVTSLVLTSFAASSLARTPCREASGAWTPASSRAVNAASSSKSSAIFAIRAKWLKARATRLMRFSSMLRNVANKASACSSPRATPKAKRRVLSTSSNTSSPSCSAITRPRMRPSNRISSRTCSLIAVGFLSSETSVLLNIVAALRDRGEFTKRV